MAYDDRVCLQCGKDISHRRSRAKFCSKRHARAYRDHVEKSYSPPAPSPSLSQDRASREFHRQWTQEEERQEPLSEYELDLLGRQRRNPGRLLPELQKIQIDRELARQHDLEARRRRGPMVEDPNNPETIGDAALRAKYDRQVNKRQDPHHDILRPPPFGQDPRPPVEAEQFTLPFNRNRLPWLPG